MLAVEKEHRKQGIGSELVVKVIQKMKEEGAHEVRSPTFNGTLSHSIGHANAVQVVLETELSNKKALQFYERLGFIRDKRLTSYYLNGMDAFRLKLILKRFPGSEDDGLEETDGIL